MSISPDAIGQIFQGGLDEMARHANLTPEQTSEGLSQLLPEVVDRVTLGRSRLSISSSERGWSSTVNGKVITDPIIAEIAAPIADPARATMLLALIGDCDPM